MDQEDRGKGERDSPNVSPISESSSHSMKQSSGSTLGRFNSNLPVPKKTRKFWNRPSVGTPEQGSSLTHWDVYSGEPTTSEKGKPPSTTPSAVKLHADPTPNKLNGYGVSTHISAGNTPSPNAIGRKRVASRDLNNAPIVRPEWKGAGGRHKIVNPLQDKPLPPGKSPIYPIGSEKHQQEQREKEALAEQSARERQERIDKEQEAQERARYKEQQDEEIRLAEENARRQQQQRMNEEQARLQQEQREGERRAEENQRRRNDTPDILQQRDTGQPSHSAPVPVQGSQGFAGHTASPYEQHSGDLTPTRSQTFPLRNSSLTVDDTRSPLARNPSNEEIKDRRSQALPDLPQGKENNDYPLPMRDTHTERVQESPYTTPNARMQDPDLNRIEEKFRDDLQNMHLQDEPPSRFSTTTYATTTYDSPPATPEIGSNSPSTTTTPNSILNRKRPVPPAGLPNSRGPARKPTPSEVCSATKATTESKRKSLPKSPPEVNAVSRVASLQAKLDNLRRRKGNLQTVIHELTHVVQPSSIAYDMASRQEIKRTVEGLNKELAEIMRDEHETGLKLHRTMKRDDEFAAYEPTSIWVRRVTS